MITSRFFVHIDFKGYNMNDGGEGDQKLEFFVRAHRSKDKAAVGGNFDELEDREQDTPYTHDDAGHVFKMPGAKLKLEEFFDNY